MSEETNVVKIDAVTEARIVELLEKFGFSGRTARLQTFQMDDPDNISRPDFEVSKYVGICIIDRQFSWDLPFYPLFTERNIIWHAVAMSADDDIPAVITEIVESLFAGLEILDELQVPRRDQEPVDIWSWELESVVLLGRSFVKKEE